MESSAKTGFNAKEVFLEATKMLYKDYLQYKQTRTNSFISDNSQEINKSKDARSSKLVLNNPLSNQENKNEKIKAPKAQSGCCWTLYSIFIIEKDDTASLKFILKY